MRKVITDLLKKMNGVEPAEIARNGKAAVDYLAAHDDIDLVLIKTNQAEILNSGYYA